MAGGTRTWLLAAFVAVLLRGDLHSERQLFARAWFPGSAINAALAVLATDAATSSNVTESTNEPVVQPEVVYSTHCASCHGRGLHGSEAGPALTGETFSKKWGQHSEDDLIDRIRTTMPPSAPGSLRLTEYKALGAWLRTGDRNQPVAVPSTPAVSGGVTTEWLFNRSDAGSTGYSPLDLINKDNVSKLQIAWRWKSDNFGPGLEPNLEATPLMAGGILYTTAGLRRDVVAIDGKTGETLWMYRIDEGERGRNAPRINSGRGVGYGLSAGSATIYFVTPGFQLIALDAKTGTPIDSFGRHGIVDVKLQLDEVVDLVTSAIGSSSPPLVMDGVVVVGPALSSGGAPPSMRNVKGSVLAFDARTGNRLWIFHTIPLAGTYGADTWKDGSAAYTGNTGAWTILSGDPKRGYVFLPVEAATSDFYGGHRPGNNLFSQSLVCLDIRSGRRVWHYQMVHHDIWDYDPPAAPVLFDIHTNGGSIPLVAQVTKQAYTFVFNRETGVPIWPIEELSVPQSTVPGELTSETQPFPSKPSAFDRQGFSDSDLIDLTPEISQEARRIAKNYTFGPLYMPQTLLTATNKGTMQSPGSLGGANWQGAVVDPESGVLYVSSMTSPSAVGLVHDPALSDMRYVVAAYAVVLGPFGLPLVRPPWGRITAIDLNTGELLWQVANADTPPEVRDHPKLQGIALPRTGIPERSGLLVTRSLLFAGEGSGLFTMDGKGGRIFRALDKKTGAIIYEFALPARQSGMPMTYAIDGKQYIVVAVGEKNNAGEFVALSLP